MWKFLQCPLAALGLAAACTPAPAAAPATSSAASTLPDRDVALARRLIAEGAIVLDVRTPAEFAAGHLDGAVLLPVQELPARIGEVERLTGGDRAKTIVVHCASGARSAKAKQMLVAAGFTRVTNAGGYADLKEAR